MNLVHDMLRATAGRTPDRAAVLAEGVAATFADLDRASDAVAHRLRAVGVCRGDRVVVLMDNVAELPACFFGVLKAGAAAVILDGGTRDRRLRFVLEHSGAAALIATADAASVVVAARSGASGLRAVIWLGRPSSGETGDSSLEEALASPSRASFDPGAIDQDLCAIIYTSGTTGEPKGVMLTHRNLSNTTRAITGYLENTPEDVVGCVLPLAYSYGLCQLLGAVHTGYSVMLERSFAFPADVLRRMAERRVTGLPGLPAIFARLAQPGMLDGVDFSSLRYVTNAAAALPSAHVRRVRELFPRTRFFSMYGQTECTRATYLDPSRVDDRPESVGRAIPNCEAYVVDELGRRVGPGVVGELVVRGSNVMRGYWRNPEATAAKLRDGPIPGEKVLHTGDLFRTDAEGLLYFVARTDDIFKCRGEKVSPREVEQVICELEGVLEAAVVGVDDPVDGQAVKAVIVPREGVPLSETDVLRFCRRRLESALVPKIVEVRSTLPRTASGKLDRKALRVRPTGA
jgi:long-chain acyl-CoA synthetase